MELKGIRLLALDVDGTLTDGGIYISESGDEFKKFNTKDGMAIKKLVKQDFQVGFISASISEQIVYRRAKMLGVQFCYAGRKNKLEQLKSWCNEIEISLDQVAYIGDDINDIECMNAVGMAICPQDATIEVKKIAKIILSAKGGDGCVREFIDQYLNAIFQIPGESSVSDQRIGKAK